MSGHVCTWCALLCASHAALEAHWASDPDCATNASVSNQTQSKYGDRTDPHQFRLRQGEPVLQAVERIEAEQAAGIARIPVLA